MSDDRRFALLKLTRGGHARNLEAALREFGILNGVVTPVRETDVGKER